jgi:hypothetical protein
LEKIIGGVTAIVSYRPGGWMQQPVVPRCALSRCARRSAARQRPRPGTENFGGEVSFQPPFTSFNYLVGASEQRRRHLEAEQLGRVKIDDECDGAGSMTTEI